MKLFAVLGFPQIHHILLLPQVYFQELCFIFHYQEMVALLYIQAVIQYHLDVFGTVETATVVKNKNDSI